MLLLKKIRCAFCHEITDFKLFGKSWPEQDYTIRQHGCCTKCGIHQCVVIDVRQMVIKLTGIILCCDNHENID